MKLKTVKAYNDPIAAVGERVLVVGGTQGIGQGVAERFARAGAEVWIVGRNATLASGVLSNMKTLSQSSKAKEEVQHRFFKADLSLIVETERLAKEIIAEAGSRGVDYLILCQGGPPNGLYVPTVEGNDRHYAVQVLSRFVITYRLTEGDDPVVKNSVMAIMAPGYTISDFDDLELVKARENGKFGILLAGKRDSTVIDAVTEEFSSRIKNIRFMHLFPGAVRTSFARNSELPWILTVLSTLVLPFIGRSKEEYAEIPFYLLAVPEGRELTATYDTHLWNENVEPIKPHLNTLKPENREKIWNHLISKLNSS
ncbi:hypothetical protein Clacol_003886 [Clathrus columnatus]|uniref:Uncharacterized protein n=1 Tax=Clathrus columnatus TaxID=1419009 RepID=A0AAV5A4Z5_9AGAM|nr:hypothetical protein Clacol_003886 [Clathrus columnatus]